MADEITCKQGCGKTFIADGAWRVKHELKCKGKVQLRGRIERLSGRADGALPVSRPQVREQNRKREVSVPAVIVAAATDKAIEVVIAGLMAKRAAIDTAIAALQAVA